jgi:hypothetical protein
MPVVLGEVDVIKSLYCPEHAEGALASTFVVVVLIKI